MPHSTFLQAGGAFSMRSLRGNPDDGMGKRQHTYGNDYAVLQVYLIDAR